MTNKNPERDDIERATKKALEVIRKQVEKENARDAEREAKKRAEGDK